MCATCAATRLHRPFQGAWAAEAAPELATLAFLHLQFASSGKAAALHVGNAATAMAEGVAAVHLLEKAPTPAIRSAAEILGQALLVDHPTVAAAPLVATHRQL